jgi:hypothetical protein
MFSVLARQSRLVRLGIVALFAATLLTVLWLIAPDRLRLTPARDGAQIAAILRDLYAVQLSPVEGPGCAWRNREEIEWTWHAFGRVADTVGGPAAFRKALAGPLSVRRYPVPELRAFAPPRGQVLLGDIVLTDYNFDHGRDYAIYLIVHEIGHVLDWRSQRALSGRFVVQIGAVECPLHVAPVDCEFDPASAPEPAPGDPDAPYAAVSSEEYWAEVFASYTYPDYYAQNPANNPVGPRTVDVVEEELTGLRKE